METLGQKLARTQTLDKARETAFVERRIAAQGEEALRKLNLVKDFSSTAGTAAISTPRWNASATHTTRSGATSRPGPRAKALSLA